ncbi:MAG: hypothetical protein CME06_11595 [Gemmatimonadetes bacterium]|nr:hypothetical protein [Gemmatimonadota bacterium]
MPASTSSKSIEARTKLLRAAYRGKHPGRLHDQAADRARRRVWSSVAHSPDDDATSIRADAALQLTLALIPGIVLAGTHLRGSSDTRVLRHWQQTGRRPAGYPLYRASGVVQLIGILLTGLATLGVGIVVAYWIMKRHSERIVFHAPPRGSARKRKGKRHK